MSNNLKLEVLLKAVDQATRPFKAIQTASKSLSGDIRTTQQSLRDLNGQVSRIDDFRRASSQLAVTGQSLKQAKQEAAALAVQFKNTENPTRTQAQAMEYAKKNASDLQLKYNDLRLSVQRQRQGLSLEGISTRKLSSDKLRLKTSISETSAQLDRQRDAFARVSAQEAKLNAVKSRYESGKKLAAGARSAGMMGMNIAMSGLSVGSQFVAPAIAFDKQISATQAALGLDKDDEKLAAIRQQARDMGASASLSPSAVARAQTMLAHSGYTADDVLAATSSTVNLSAAAGIDVAEAANILAPLGQAPTALDALEVKTRDKQGNMLPIESILKSINAAFTKNDLSAAQQAEYLKAIFGEEALKGAQSLIAADTTEFIAKIQTNNLDGDLKKLQSVWEGLQIDVFEKQNSSLRQLTQSATQWLGTLTTWINANPELIKMLSMVATGTLAIISVLSGFSLVAWPVITVINAIVTAASMLGSVFTVAGSAIVTALGAITWPAVAVAAVVVAGALLIRKYWEPISAFFGGVIEGLMSAFAPIAGMFAPLAPVFDGLGEKLRGVWQWFNDLIAPVKVAEDTLNSCRGVGIIFGQALADALMLPLNAFNKLRSGIDWVLEKIGIINKESSSLEQTAAKASAASMENEYIPTPRSYGGYLAYQPVTTPAGKTYLDQSSPTYQITLQGNGMPGGQLGYELQDALEKFESQRRSNARASFMHD